MIPPILWNLHTIPPVTEWNRLDMNQGPKLTVDAIIRMGSKEQIVLVRRKNEPRGWSLPGGFVEYGESVEHAILREVMEETRLDVDLVRQFHTYSDPSRDPRIHAVSVVFIADGRGEPTGDDDAEEAHVFSRDSLPTPIVFDHVAILNDYFSDRY